MLDVDEVPCVVQKLAEARSFRQVRAEAAAKAEADAAADARELADLARAGAGGGLAQTRFVLGGLPRQRGKGLRGGGDFVGRPGLYADDGALERLLSSHGADVLHLSRPGDADVFRPDGTITLCTDSRAVLVVSDGYDRPDGRPAKWLYCFSAKGRAVKESYIEALAAEDFDFDRVPLGPHLAYEPGTYIPRAV